MIRKGRAAKIIVYILSACMIVFPLNMPIYARDGGESGFLFDTQLTLPGPADITSDIAVGALPDGVSILPGGVSVTSPSTSLFSFTSDDGSNKDWNFRDVFIDRGVSCTIPLVEDYASGHSGTSQVSVNNMLTLQNEYGYEIGSHSYDHVELTLFSYEDMVMQLTESKRSLTEMGFHVTNMYLPFGDYNDTVLDEAIKYYRSVRTSKIGYNSPLDKRKLQLFWLDSGNFSLDDAKEVVDTARNTANQFVIFGFHANVASRNFMDNTIGALIDYIQQFDDTQVLTVEKALDRLENKINHEFDYRLENGKIVLSRFFLKSLPYGQNTLIFNFSDSSSETLTVTIDRDAEMPHIITVTDCSLQPGHNILDANRIITVRVTVNSGPAGERSSTAAIGGATVPGVLEGNTYTYTFRTNDIPDGTYDKLIIQSVAGDSQVTLEQTISLTIEKSVPESGQVMSLSLTAPPNKLSYYQYEQLNLDGLTVTAEYKDGSSSAVDITELTCTGDTDNAGTAQVYISYCGFDLSFEITVTARSIISIEITRPPNVTQYFVGEQLSLAGIEVTATKPDGTTEVTRNYTVYGYDPQKPGQQQITVEQEGCVDSFTVTVIPLILESIDVLSNPTKMQYLEGEPFDPQGLVVAAYYNNGDSPEITDYTLSGYSPTPGVKTIVISYQGCETSFSVNVKAKQLTMIKVTTPPNRVTYTEGFDDIDLTGMVVTVYYNNGTSQPVYSYYLGDYSTTPGTKTIPVYYSGLETSFTITVTARSQLPDTITTSVFYFNKQTSTISKIGQMTGISSLVSGISEKDYVKVFKGSNEVKGGTYAATGMVLKLVSGNQTGKSATLVVTGDINGDGKITLTDFVNLKSHLLGKSTLSGCYLKAADVNGDGKTTLTDFVILKSYLLGKQTIKPQKY